MPYKDPDFCSKVRNKIEKWRDAWRDNAENYHYYFNFVMGNQWDDDEDDVLRQYNKYPMVMNKLSPLAKHILGEQRMNTPSLQVIAEDDVPQDTVTTRQALLKDILFDSDVQIVYQNAFQQAVVGGFGAYWIGTDYVNNSSFDQKPVFYSIKDATKCYWDVSAEHFNKVDGSHAGFIRRISRERFKERYGIKIERTIGVSYGDLDTSFVWSNADEIAVVYHQERKLKRDKLYELSDGSMVYKKEFNTLEKQIFTNMDGEEVEMVIYNGQPVTVEKERNIDRYTVKMYELAGDYVLDEIEMPCEYLTIVFVDQNSFWDKKGKQICVPYFKDAKDAQKFINYIATQSAYCMKVSRYDQFLASKANIKSPETQAIWKDPMRHQGALTYDIDTVGNTKPERLSPPEFSSAFLTMYERSMRDIETSTGMYSAKLGDDGTEKSGKAIDARTRQGSYINYVVFDSLNRSITTGGVVVNQMISKLFDTKRVVSLDMPDVGMQKVVLNNPEDEYGNQTSNDMTKGEFRIKLVAGASIEGQNEESVQAMQAILNAAPETFKLFADLYADNLKSNNKIELRNRLRTIVPPDVIEAGKTGKPLPPAPPQPDPQMLMAQAKISDIDLKRQQLMIEAENANRDFEAKLAELETERMETAASVQEQILRYQSEMKKTETDQNIAHANNLVKILTHLKEPQIQK